MNNIEDAMWKTKRIGGMDRAELLEVVAYLIARYDEMMTPEVIRARSLGRVEMLRRGEVRPSDRS